MASEVHLGSFRDLCGSPIELVKETREKEKDSKWIQLFLIVCYFKALQIFAIINR